MRYVCRRAPVVESQSAGRGASGVACGGVHALALRSNREYRIFSELNYYGHRARSVGNRIHRIVHYEF